MNILLPLVLAFFLLWLGYRFYGRFIARQMGEEPERPTPANALKDSKDFVPTKTHILFAHHFSTIAGVGPIVGPTLGILYGFTPAWLWVVFGAIFFGAVHDFASLFASLREGGKSIGEIAGISLGRTGKLLFLIFTLMMIFLVTSAFLSVTATSLTSMYPLEKLGLTDGQTMLKTDASGENGVIGGIASTSVIIITLFAPFLGWMIYRKSLKTVFGYILAAIVCALSIYVGFLFPVTLSPTIWMIIISLYVLVAAGVPVWVILQPRDFTNVQILYGGMVMLFASIIIGGFTGMHISFPSFSVAAGIEHMGFIWPMLMITIACGAISGFHALVATGTSAKQVSSERAAGRVGFGAMILEGALAILVIITIASALSYSDYLNIVWPDKGSNPVLAFALAVGGMIHHGFGISIALGAIFGILLIEGFVVTTLDSAVRLNRYLFEEFWELLFTDVPPLLKKFWFNSGLSVLIMFSLAYFNAFKLIWPLFGSANQLMAALSLIAVSVWLYYRGRKNWYTLVPAVVMVITTVASLVYMLFKIYLPSGNIVLISADLLMLVLSLGVIGLSIRSLGKLRHAAKHT